MNENTQTYVGVKAVKATPMTRGDYNKYRQWTIPNGEDQDAEGYLVEYLDGIGPPNVVGHAGYVTWTPKAPFEAAYRQIPETHLNGVVLGVQNALDSTSARFYK